MLDFCLYNDSSKLYLLPSIHTHQINTFSVSTTISVPISGNHQLFYWLHSTYRYRALPFSMSGMTVLASFIGRLLFHVLTPFSAKKLSMAWISAGPPVLLPHRLARLPMREKPVFEKEMSEPRVRLYID